MATTATVQTYGRLIRCSRVRAAVDRLILWVAQSSSPLPRSWLVL